MNSFFKNWFRNTVSALVYTSIEASGTERGGRGRNEVVEFVLRQHAAMPDYLRLPLAGLTIVFDFSGLLIGGRLFHRQEIHSRRALCEVWRCCPIGPCRDLVRFYDSLALLVWLSEQDAQAKEPNHFQTKSKMVSTPLRQVAVLGSGPGGAITAALLAERGFDVVLLEEGGNRPLESCEPFSVGEMIQKYRNGGLTPAFGRPKVAYVEGCTAGGGSEINSGLYHRTPPEILEHWRKKFALDAGDAEMLSHFEACERDVSVGLSPGVLPKASLKLQEGASKLGWEAREIPRWFAYDGGVDSAGIATGQRQSMTRTFLKRFEKAGGTIESGVRALKITSQNHRFRIETARSGAIGGESFECEKVFVSCGAIGTPLLLKRSGISGAFGRGLQMHPTIKVVAEFDEEVNSEAMGVPVHQVKEFAPAFSFGCSISSKPYLALALLDHPEELPKLEFKWKRMAIYYAMIVPVAEGSVNAVPGYRDAIVRFHLTPSDQHLLATALRKLSELLFAAGAVRLMPSISGFGMLENPSELSRIPTTLPKSFTNLMTIHLFSSCRMGENPSLCSADSLGRVRGLANLHIADASLLPSAPGVNPQGSVMAFARRNALHFADANFLK
jgi:choline dehydrogenase-like flavoprotein